MLIDSHCHLDFPGLIEDKDGVLTRADEAGVEMMLTINTRLSTFDGVVSIIEAHRSVYGTVGVHPHQADEEGPETAAPLLARCGHPKIIGIGEAGLDYFHNNSTPANQEKGFRAHIAAARASGLPLIVHTRDADDDTVRILGEELEKGRFEAVIHCYSSSPELGTAAIEMGFYLGIGGILTFKRSAALRETIAAMPLDRLLLETDSPYLAPEPFRGKRNEPAYVAKVAARLAETRGIEIDEIERATTANFFRLFQKAEPPSSMERLS